MRARRTAMMLTDVECGGVRLLLLVLVMCREAVLLGNSGRTKGECTSVSPTTSSGFRLRPKAP